MTVVPRLDDSIYAAHDAFVKIDWEFLLYIETFAYKQVAVRVDTKVQCHSKGGIFIELSVGNPSVSLITERCGNGIWGHRYSSSQDAVGMNHSCIPVF